MQRLNQGHIHWQHFAYSRHIYPLEFFFFELENNKNFNGQRRRLYASAANECAPNATLHSLLRHDQSKMQLNPDLIHLSRFERLNDITRCKGIAFYKSIQTYLILRTRIHIKIPEIPAIRRVNTTMGQMLARKVARTMSLASWLKLPTSIISEYSSEFMNVTNSKLDPV